MDLDDDDSLSGENVAELLSLCSALKAHVKALEDDRLKLMVDLRTAQDTGKDCLERLSDKDVEIKKLKIILKRSKDESNARIQRLLEENAKALHENDLRMRIIVDKHSKASSSLIDEKHRNQLLREALASGANKLEEADVQLIQAERDKQHAKWREEMLINEEKMRKAEEARKVQESYSRERDDELVLLRKQRSMDKEELQKQLDVSIKSKEDLEKTFKAFKSDTAETSKQAAEAIKALEGELDDLRAISGNAATEAANEIAGLKEDLRNLQEAKEMKESELEEHLAAADAHSKRLEIEMKELRATKSTVEMTMQTLSGLAKQLGGVTEADEDETGNNRNDDSDDEDEQQEPEEPEIELEAENDYRNTSNHQNSNQQNQNPNFNTNVALAQAITSAMANLPNNNDKSNESNGGISSGYDRQVMAARIEQLELALMEQRSLWVTTERNLRDQLRHGKKSQGYNNNRTQVNNIKPGPHNQLTPDQGADAIGQWYQTRGAELLHSSTPHRSLSPSSTSRPRSLGHTPINMTQNTPGSIAMSVNGTSGVSQNHEGLVASGRELWQPAAAATVTPNTTNVNEDISDIDSRDSINAFKPMHGSALRKSMHENKLKSYGLTSVAMKNNGNNNDNDGVRPTSRGNRTTMNSGVPSMLPSSLDSNQSQGWYSYDEEGVDDYGGFRSNTPRQPNFPQASSSRSNNSIGVGRSFNPAIQK